jgi:hypothetical protein
MLKNECCLCVIISIRFFLITICNLLFELPSYLATDVPLNNFCFLLTATSNDMSASHIYVWVRNINAITLRAKNRNTLRITYFSATLFTTNPRWTVMGSNQSLCWEIRWLTAWSVEFAGKLHKCEICCIVIVLLVYLNFIYSNFEFLQFSWYI